MVVLKEVETSYEKLTLLDRDLVGDIRRGQIQKIL